MLENYFEPPGGLDNKIPDSNGLDLKIRTAEISDTGDDEQLEYASEELVLNALNDAFKSDQALFNKLKQHAIKWYALVDFKRNATDDDAADVVIESVIKIISLRRKWYNDKVPNIVNLILLVIVSEIRNGRKKKNPFVKETSFYNKDGELIEENSVDIIRAYLREDIFNGNTGEQIEDWITRLFNIFEKNNDVSAYFVLENLLEVDRTIIKEPEIHIASELKIDVAEVKNAIRRIKRNIHQLINNKHK